MTRTERTLGRLGWPLLAIGLIGLTVVVMILFRDNAERAARNASQDRAISALRNDNASLSTGVSDLKGATSEANRRLKSAGKRPVTVPNVDVSAPEQGEAGRAGQSGRNGINGLRGPQGAAGAAGAAGQTIVGPTGAQGAKGDTGAAGAKGEAGATGRDGQSGADSTVPGPRGEQGEAGTSAYPFTFTFTIPGALGDTTYTCTVTSSSDSGSCASS